MPPIAQNEQEWTLVIRPQGGWFDLGLGELWRYRDLVVLFVWRDFVATYKQTILGPLWNVLQPLFTTLIFTIIFGRVAGISTDGLPQPLFYMCGLTCWTYFSDCLNRTSGTFISNAGIFGKVYFPRLAVPVSVVMSSLIKFGIQFGLFLGLMMFYWARGAALQPNAWLFLAPILVLEMAGLGLGLGIIVSALTTKYRDLQVLIGFGVQLFMYATPVIYPASAIPEKYKMLLYANPLTGVIETFRHAFLGGGVVQPALLLYGAVVTVLVLAVGILLFNRVERTFMDTV